MPGTAKNVQSSKRKGILSRRELLVWVNECLKAEFSKVEDFCTGAAYCQIMNILFPGSIPMKQVAFQTNILPEYVFNLRLLQESFRKTKVEKLVPINDLVKGHFKDNYLFMLWFKDFFHANYNGQEYDAVADRGMVPIGVGPRIKKTRHCSPGRTISSKVIAGPDTEMPCCSGAIRKVTTQSVPKDYQKQSLTKLGDLEASVKKLEVGHKQLLELNQKILLILSSKEAVTLTDQQGSEPSNENNDEEC